MQNHLAATRQVALVLRLTIDGQGQLLHGEVVAMQGEVIGRFSEWSSLIGVIQAWIDNRGKGLSDNRVAGREM